MASFLVVSKTHPAYRVRVADCSREHAESVLKALRAHTETPDDLKLKRSWRG